MKKWVFGIFLALNAMAFLASPAFAAAECPDATAEVDGHLLMIKFDAPVDVKQLTVSLEVNGERQRLADPNTDGGLFVFFFPQEYRGAEKISISCFAHNNKNPSRDIMIEHVAAKVQNATPAVFPKPPCVQLSVELECRSLNTTGSGTWEWDADSGLCCRTANVADQQLGRLEQARAQGKKAATGLAGLFARAECPDDAVRLYPGDDGFVVVVPLGSEPEFALTDCQGPRTPPGKVSESGTSWTFPTPTGCNAQEFHFEVDLGGGCVHVFNETGERIIK